MKFAKIKCFFERLSTTVKRFPLAVLLLFLYTVYAIIIENNYEAARRLIELRVFMWLLCYPVLAALLSVVLNVFRENSGRWRKPVSWVSHAVLLVGTFAVVFFYDDLAPIKFIHVFTTIVVVLLCGLCIFPSFGHKSDDALWNSETPILKALCMAFFVSQACWALYFPYIYCMREFFDWKMSSSAYMDGMIFCSAFLFPFLFLAGFPRLRECSGEPSFDKTRKMLCNIGAVVTLFYFLLLYAYMVKILVTWSLPKGTVVYAVSIASLLAIAMLDFLYPVKFHPELKLQNSLRKIIPVALLPLLVLMTVGIGRRVLDYGLTVPRIYVIALNLWFYGVVAIQLAKVFRRKIWWTAISFVSFLIVLCFVPFESQGYPDLFARKASVEKNVPNMDSVAIAQPTAIETPFEVAPKKFYYKSRVTGAPISVPQGYSSFVQLNSVFLNNEDIHLQDDALVLKFRYNGAPGNAEQRVAEFSVPTFMMLDSAEYYGRNYSREKPIEIDNGNAKLMIFSASIETDVPQKGVNHSHVEGFLFLK